MNNQSKKSIFITIITCFIILSVFCGCNSNTRSPLSNFLSIDTPPDVEIHIPLETHNAEIIIKEWLIFFDNEVNIYYKSNGNETFIGNISDGPEGFLPFKEGMYTVEVEGNKLIIEWCKFPGNKEKPWEKDTFELPISTSDNK